MLVKKVLTAKSRMVFTLENRRKFSNFLLMLQIIIVYGLAFASRLSLCRHELGYDRGYPGL